MKTTTNSNGMQIEVYSDASGAPSLYRLDGWIFACDCTGEIKVRIVGESSRKPSRKTLAMVESRYVKALHAVVDAAWLAANAAMYA